MKEGWVWVLDGLTTLVETGDALSAQTVDLEPPVDDAIGEWHRSEAIDATNATWELLERPARTPEEDEDLVRRAYAAAYHWARAARRGPENAARAEYLVARVQAVLGRAELALHHARRCVAITAGAHLADFDLADAHEAMARALAAGGDSAGAERELSAARCVPVADPDDRAIVDADLAAAAATLLARV